MAFLRGKSVFGIWILEEGRSFDYTRDDTFSDVYVSYLVKYGLTRANETPFEHFLSVVGILHRVTYVENLTFVGDVGVVSCKMKIITGFQWMVVRYFISRSRCHK